ncbi:hypothetical protein K505DRAFT_379338 [Melanomma pulvis-pyrius CBS 109.77]|uniref:Uncharacterized protein n=1 Tax=Melanomma pulvis-pyrius CBS 109.77 TaxID=1314802 RepID=A0A6A6WVQ3_9PLEO|nr:hypothetical protein K505DRAFT_379338 [Melanomma pulvis-pyrius CBS 109.77]
MTTVIRGWLILTSTTFLEAAQGVEVSQQKYPAQSNRSHTTSDALSSQFTPYLRRYPRINYMSLADGESMACFYGTRLREINQCLMTLILKKWVRALIPAMNLVVVPICQKHVTLIVDYPLWWKTRRLSRTFEISHSDILRMAVDMMKMHRECDLIKRNSGSSWVLRMKQIVDDVLNTCHRRYFTKSRSASLLSRIKEVVTRVMDSIFQVALLHERYLTQNRLFEEMGNKDDGNGPQVAWTPIQRPQKRYGNMRHMAPVIEPQPSIETPTSRNGKSTITRGLSKDLPTLPSSETPTTHNDESTIDRGTPKRFPQLPFEMPATYDDESIIALGSPKDFPQPPLEMPATYNGKSTIDHGTSKDLPTPPIEPLIAYSLTAESSSHPLSPTPTTHSNESSMANSPSGEFSTQPLFQAPTTRNEESTIAHDPPGGFLMQPFVPTPATYNTESNMAYNPSGEFSTQPFFPTPATYNTESSMAYNPSGEFSTQPFFQAPNAHNDGSTIAHSPPGDFPMQPFFPAPATYNTESSMAYNPLGNVPMGPLFQAPNAHNDGSTIAQSLFGDLSTQPFFQAPPTHYNESTTFHSPPEGFPTQPSFNSTPHGQVHSYNNPQLYHPFALPSTAQDLAAASFVPSQPQTHIGPAFRPESSQSTSTHSSFVSDPSHMSFPLGLPENIPEHARNPPGSPKGRKRARENGSLKTQSKNKTAKHSKSSGSRVGHPENLQGNAHNSPAPRLGYPQTFQGTEPSSATTPIGRPQHFQGNASGSATSTSERSRNFQEYVRSSAALPLGLPQTFQEHAINSATPLERPLNVHGYAHSSAAPQLGRPENVQGRARSPPTTPFGHLENFQGLEDPFGPPQEANPSEARPPLETKIVNSFRYTTLEREYPRLRRHPQWDIPMTERNPCRKCIGECSCKLGAEIRRWYGLPKY